MRFLVLTSLLFGVNFVAHAEQDVETVYKSVIPKSSACFSAKLDNEAAAKCDVSCGEALGNLRVLVGLPQPLSEEMQKQVATCEADYVAFAGKENENAGSVEVKTEAVEPEVDTSVETVRSEIDSDEGLYAALKTELSGLEKACSEVKPNRMSRLCEKFCGEAVTDLGSIEEGDSNMVSMLKNSQNDIEKLPSVRQCRLRYRTAFR